MPVSVKIDNRTNRRPCGFDVDKMIRKLLRHCEPEHLVGLDKIIILDSFSGNEKNYNGYYYRKHGQRKPTIYLCFNNIFWGKTTLTYCFRFIVRFNLARTLYHEIGHHVHYTLKHGVRKENAEDFANRYQRKMWNQAAPKWRYILYPIHLIILLINRLITKKA
jgi:hypothetical protein